MSQILDIRPGQALTIQIEDESTIEELISVTKDSMVSGFVPTDHDGEIIIEGVCLRDEGVRSELFSRLYIEEGSDQAIMLMNARLIHLYS